MIRIHDPNGRLSRDPRRWPQSIKDAIAECCCGGSGSGGGPQMPNGCSACDCCPCVCWWYTAWHNQVTKDNLLRSFPFTVPIWTLVSNTLTNAGGNPDFTYLGDIGVGECTLGGVTAIDENGDVTADVPPNPLWTGVLTYTDGVDTVEVEVTITLSFTISFTCDNPVEIADAVVWSGTVIESVTPGFAFDLAGTINGQQVDYAPLPNDIIGGSGIITDCAGTVEFVADNGVILPSITITPMLDPNC